MQYKPGCGSPKLVDCLLNQLAMHEGARQLSPCTSCGKTEQQLDDEANAIGGQLVSDAEDILESHLCSDDGVDGGSINERSLDSVVESGRLDATLDDFTANLSHSLDASFSVDAEPWQTVKPIQSPVLSNPQSMVLKQRSFNQLDDENLEARQSIADADYHVQKLLGVGGMGSVYSARQQSMDRRVAIKVLKRDAEHCEASRAAFVSEAIITGGLDHPNIVPIYDVGSQNDDAPFYSMKQVEGVEWKTRIKEQALPENLDCLLRVCDAVAFAHDRRILHRDLKPENIMLGPFGEVLVMDWGLAIPTLDHPNFDSFPKRYLGGTPTYMAPEMVNDVDAIDHRSDVYLLGAILFEIITGKAPHHLDSLPKNRRMRMMSGFQAAAQNVIAETDEAGELLEIALKAIATDRNDRYQSVREFQAAIREYLAHEESIELAARANEHLAQARQSGDYNDFSRARFGFETALDQWPDNIPAEQGLSETCRDYSNAAFDRGDFDLALSLLDPHDSEDETQCVVVRNAIDERKSRQRQVRRLRVAMLAASLAIAFLASAAALWVNSERNKAILAQREEATQREIAQRNEKEAVQQRQVAKLAATEARAAEAVAEQEKEKTLRSFAVAERNAYYSDMLLAPQSWDKANMDQLQSILDRYEDREDLKSFEWHLWNRLAHSEQLSFGDGQSVSSFAFSPDGTRLACSSTKSKFHLWNVLTGKKVTSFDEHKKRINDLAYHPDGTRLASASADTTIKIWDPQTGKSLQTFSGHAEEATHVLFSPDGNQLFSADKSGTIKVWDIQTGTPTRTFSAHEMEIQDLAISPDAAFLVTACRGDSVKRWHLKTGGDGIVLEGIRRGSEAVEFSRDGTQLFVSGKTGNIKIYQATTGKLIRSVQAHAHPVTRFSFNSTGTRLATSSQDHMVKIWDSSSLDHQLTLRGHRKTVNHLSWSPDDTRLASAGFHGSVNIWGVDMAEPAVSLALSKLEQHASRPCSVAFNPGGYFIASAGDGDANVVKIWQASQGVILKQLVGHSDVVHSVAFHPDNERLASASSDQSVKIWNVTTREEIQSLEGHKGVVRHVAFSTNGRLLVSSSDDFTAKVWDVETGDCIVTLDGHTQKVNQSKFSPDGLRLATVGDDKKLKIWDVASWQERWTSEASHQIVCLAYSPSGGQIVTGNAASVLNVWDARTGDLIRSLLGHSDGISDLSFTPDGSRLATISSDGLKIWDPDTGRETLTLPAGRRAARLSFSPDGKRLAVSSGGNRINIWDSRPWTPSLRAKAQARGYLTVHRNRVETLNELRAYIQNDETIGEPVRQRALDWAERFWKAR